MANPLRHLYRRSLWLRRLSRRAKNAAVYWPTRFALAALRRLDLETALHLAERVGGALFLVLRTSRRLALEHLRLAFGDELSAAARRHLARASFVNVARCVCEIAKIDEIQARADTYFEVDGWEHLETVLAAGRGAVAITGHVGNWELLAAYFPPRGVPVAAIARRIYEPRLNQLLLDLRTRLGVQTIMRESPHATRDILRVLKNRGLLAMLIDQDTKAASVSVPFFGRSARTPAAAAVLAFRRQLPVIAAFIQRRATGGHRITILPPFKLPDSGDRK
ncbi:MAG TPA: lysophospholipid acyltransferase family protein, partial [Candidatus Kryptonia bacterium]|nr:lysophospholipid acyltransferase family protein [Candidatus Kryptonia bacterium]